MIFFVLTEESDQKGRDIVFLLDGSDNTRNVFGAIRDFLYNVIGKLNVGPNNDRVAVIQFSNVAVANFYLNSFLLKEDVLTSVRRLTHKGGRPLNTGEALNYVKDNVFTTSSGSRKSTNIPQMLVVLSGGRSNDNVDVPATALKESGVFVLGIGTKDSESKELEMISHDPRSTFSISEFTELPNIQEQLISAIGEMEAKGMVIGKN